MTMPYSLRLRRIGTSALAAVVCLCAAIPADGQALSFQYIESPINITGTEGLRATAISLDGTCFSGYGQLTEAPITTVFRWKVGQFTPVISSPLAPGFGNNNPISADGAWMAGLQLTNPYTAYRWSESTSVEIIADVPTATIFGARGISADGATVVGGSGPVAGPAEAFRWTSSEGLIGLGDIPGGPNGSRWANAVSADGSVIVGIGDVWPSYTSPQTTQAFRWTSETGMVGLGDLPGGADKSSASAVSADGQVVVGSGASANGLEAFRWSLESGMVGLGDLPGGSFSSAANAVSGDGAIIVGRGNINLGNTAFIWDQAFGMRQMSTFLTGLGLNLQNTILDDAVGISADSTVIVGNGRRNNRNVVWRAVIPEPATAVLLIWGYFGLIGKRAIRRPHRSA